MITWPQLTTILPVALPLLEGTSRERSWTRREVGDKESGGRLGERSWARREAVG